MNEAPPPAPPRVFDDHRRPRLRLFGIVLLFLVSCAYAVWKSDRFQGLIHGVSQSRLAEALGRPVTFRTVELRVFPPAVRLADVRIGNDPRLPGPLLTVEEVSIGGGVSVVGRELRLGKIRALRPRAYLSQAPDGTWNLPPGLSGPSRGGLKLHIGSVLVQEGVLELQGRKIGIDGTLENFSAELVSVANDRYRGSLEARRATLKLPGAEPLVMALSTRFALDAARGLTLENASVSGAFGKLSVAGSLETSGRANAVFTAAGDVSIDEIERVFHSGLDFSGGAHVEARIDVPPAGGFRITAAVAAPRVRSNQFVFENLAATVAAPPENLTARIDRADYAGEKASGVYRISTRTGKPQPMTLAVEGANISLERFFADISLKGTGLSGAAALSVAMRWGEAGISRADGGGMVSIAAGPAVSIVAGRAGVPTSGGGALAIVNGRIGLETVTLRFPQSTLDLTGGFKIGVWQPDFDFQLRSKDLTEIDRLFQNFFAAAGEKPERLGLGGSGELQGHLAGTWSDPDATAQITAEAARYSGVPFGGVHGAVDMRDGAFLFHPLRVYDGDASLSLEGTARYRPAAGHPRFDLAISAHAYPLPRLLQYLELDFPVEGKLTGDLRVAGTPPGAVTGGGPIELGDAVVWGQKLARVTGRVRFEPGRFAIDDMRAALGGGVIGGSGALAITERTFEARLAGDAVPLEAVELFRPLSPDVKGNLSFQLSGGGSLDRPDLKITASVARATFYGHPVPENLEPRVEATVRRGVLDASAGVLERWSLKAGGDLFGDPARMDLSLDATDLGAFLLLTPLALPAGGGGSLAVAGNLTLPRKAGEFLSGTLTVTRAQLDFPGRPGVIAAKGTVSVALGQGKVTFREFEAAGGGSFVKIRVTHGVCPHARRSLSFGQRECGRVAPLDRLAGPRDDGPAGRGPARVRIFRRAGPVGLGARRERQVPDDGARPGRRRHRRRHHLPRRARRRRGARPDGRWRRLRRGEFRVERDRPRRFPVLHPGPPRRGALSAGPPAGRGRGPRRDEPDRIQRRPRRGRPAKRDLFERHRAHDPRPALEGPARRLRRGAGAVEGEDGARGPHRLGRGAGGPQQSGAPDRDSGSPRARDPRVADARRADPPRRRGAYHFPRRAVRDRTRHHRFRRERGVRADHRHPRARRGQQVRHRREPRGNVAPHPDERLLRSASPRRNDRGNAPDRGLALRAHDDRHDGADCLARRRHRRRRRDRRPHAPHPAALQARPLPDRSHLHRKRPRGRALDRRQADHAEPARDLLAVLRREQAADPPARVVDQRHDGPPGPPRRRRQVSDRCPPAAEILGKL